jgi:DNA-binding beta-propeller fold protein YncE
VWRIDARDGRVVARIPVGSNPMFGPQFMAAAAGSVWVGVPGLKAVVRIDPKRNEVVATVPVADGGVCGQLVADDDAVWVASGGCGDGALTRIDPRTNEVVARVTSSDWGAVFGGALGFGSLWIGTDGGPFEVDPATNEIVSRLTLAGDPVWGGDLAVGAGSLWVHDGDDESVIRMGPSG